MPKSAAADSIGEGTQMIRCLKSLPSRTGVARGILMEQKLGGMRGDEGSY